MRYLHQANLINNPFVSQVGDILNCKVFAVLASYPCRERYQRYRSKPNKNQLQYPVMLIQHIHNLALQIHQIPFPYRIPTIHEWHLRKPWEVQDWIPCWDPQEYMKCTTSFFHQISHQCTTSR
jgi:hypothetical protein